MRANKVKKLWQQGKPATMAWLSTADTYVAEIMGNAGIDALVLDMQHGMAIGPDRVGVWLQAVSASEAVPFVRVPWNEPVFIQWVLDAGAYGIIVPLVNNREEAAKAAGACRYPPAGYRSVGPNRVSLYGGADYIEHANEEIICLVMIEDIRTVARVEELAGVPGIDGFYIGPADLAMSMSMGISPGIYLQSTAHAEACQRVLDVAGSRNLVAGIHCGSAEEALKRTLQGFRFCPAINDISALSAAARTAVQTVKKSSDAKPK
jgi:4-hydroxy-2-oxoheptanedioate aldolase